MRTNPRTSSTTNLPSLKLSPANNHSLDLSLQSSENIIIDSIHSASRPSTIYDIIKAGQTQRKTEKSGRLRETSMR